MTQIRDAATLILLREHQQQLQVLMMKRNKAVKFIGGFWVFPGGAVDDSDKAMLGEPINEPADLSVARIAAVRETYEEAGVTIDEQRLVTFSHWTAPEGTPKRFATWFFVAPMNEQTVQHDGSEMIASEWLSPSDAIAKHAQGEIDMLPPTYVSLMKLAAYNTVDEALAAIKQQQAIRFLPKVSMHNNAVTMLYNGDAGYDAADASIEGEMHRCVHQTSDHVAATQSSGWQYINTL